VHRISARRSRLGRAMAPASAGPPPDSAVSCSLLQGVEICADVNRSRWIHEHVEDLRFEARSLDFDFVRSDGERQPLEYAIEVVDDARIVTVDEDGRITRSDLQSHIAVVDARTVDGCRHVPINPTAIRGAIPIARANSEKDAKGRAIVMIEPWPHHLDARPRRNVSANRIGAAIVVPPIPSIVSATIDRPVHLASQIVVACDLLTVPSGLVVRALLLAVGTLLLAVRTRLALVISALFVCRVALIARTRASVSLVLVASAILPITLGRLCDRPAHTQRKCQSSDRNKCFAEPHG
jgi:hypothetical protein